ncbi:MAG TPA: copper chaperone [Acidimicrobiia bacterium]|nr:copper chaperone [Acidimicrobiia bacterium]
MTTATLTVPDISCGHCKSSIEGAVKELQGVEEVTVDIEPKTVSLSYDDSSVSIDQIIAAIEDQGYTVPR